MRFARGRAVSADFDAARGRTHRRDRVLIVKLLYKPKGGRQSAGMYVRRAVGKRVSQRLSKREQLRVVSAGCVHPQCRIVYAALRIGIGAYGRIYERERQSVRQRAVAVLAVADDSGHTAVSEQRRAAAYARHVVVYERTFYIAGGNEIAEAGIRADNGHFPAEHGYNIRALLLPVCFYIDAQGSAAGVERIHHLENRRHLMRALIRIYCLGAVSYAAAVRARQLRAFIKRKRAERAADVPRARGAPFGFEIFKSRAASYRNKLRAAFFVCEGFHPSACGIYYCAHEPVVKHYVVVCAGNVISVLQIDVVCLRGALPEYERRVPERGHLYSDEYPEIMMIPVTLQSRIHELCFKLVSVCVGQVNALKIARIIPNCQVHGHGARPGKSVEYVEYAYKAAASLGRGHAGKALNSVACARALGLTVEFYVIGGFGGCHVFKRRHRIRIYSLRQRANSLLALRIGECGCGLIQRHGVLA